MMIRPAILGEESAITALQIKGWQAAYADVFSVAYLQSLKPERWLGQWHDFIHKDDPQKRLFVADDKDVIRGFISNGPSRKDHPDPHEGEISALYVDPDYYGQGLGRELLKHALEWHRAAGRQHVYVRTPPEKPVSPFLQQKRWSFITGKSLRQNGYGRGLYH